MGGVMPKPPAAFSTFTTIEIEAVLLAQPRHELLDGRAPRLAVDVADHQYFHG